MKLSSLIAAALAAALPAGAQDFSENSDARSWNLYAEVPARFEARVVDILCELTGDCAENCGGGDRQLGLVRSADDALVFPNKNAQPAFNGAVAELLPYCEQMVEVDGLLIEDPDLGAQNVYLVQKIRTLGEDDWMPATRWTEVWAQKHPEAAGSGPWFRRDPRVNAMIEETGHFGLGLEWDREIKDELFQ